MSDWDKVKSKNQEKFNRLNLPSFKSTGKIFIFDKYCPRSSDVFQIKKVIDTVEDGLHGYWVGQISKLIAGDEVEFHGSGYTHDFDRVVDYCIENNIRVINSSITGGYSKEKDLAIKRFAELGGIWVASAGNYEDKGVQFPAKSDYTIAVSATNTPDCNGPEITITADSNWYLRNLKPDMFHTFPGTSATSPVIAGCVRLILDKYPHYKLSDVVKYLQDNSTTEMESLEEYERFFSFPDGFGKEVEEVKLELFIDENILLVDGKKKLMDTAPFIQDNRTFVPIRFIAEELGCKVTWDNINKRVIIEKGV